MRAWEAKVRMAQGDMEEDGPSWATAAAMAKNGISGSN